MAIETKCLFNPAILCTDLVNGCDKHCGWNPKEEKRRKERIQNVGLTVRKKDGKLRLSIKRG